MNAFFCRGFVLALGVAACARAADFHFENQTLSVPDGFEIELVAAPPLVQRPIAGAFDEKGNLYVTDSAGVSEKAPQQAETNPNRVLRLEAANASGHFEKSTVFADGIAFPEGCMWRDGSLYVAAPPRILKLTDTRGGGVADKREVWFDGKTVTGCGNDLHGPFNGPDGWIYWCKGAFAEQRYTLANGKAFVTRASHIFRARPDGTGIEPVITGGMDNPVGLAFTSAGERFLTATFLQMPAGGKRDGIIHAIYGGVWGKPHDVIDSAKKTGDLMPVMTHLGPAAPCGIIAYKSRVFGDGFHDNLFVCQFNTHKVSRHVLVPDGATFRTLDSDFVTSDSPDFHPTDVIEDADGSLLVVDTGGWYKICCPTSQLAKPDILGAIYRVRKKDAALPGGKKPEQKDAANLWLKELNEISFKREAAARPALLEALRDEKNPLAQRLAAEALGRIGDKSSVPALLAAANAKTDRALEHAIIFALLEIGDRNATAPGLKSANSSTRRAALIALDQMDNGGLKAEDVTPLLSSSDEVLKSTAWWIVGHHIEWGGALAGFFRERLAAPALAENERADLQSHLARVASNAAIQDLLADTIRNAKLARDARLAALRAMAASGLKEMPESWIANMPLALSTGDVAIVQQAVATTRAFLFTKKDAPALVAALVAAGKNAALPIETRLAALAAVPGGLKNVEPSLFDFLRENIVATKPLAIRSVAASALATAKLSPQQLTALLDSFKTAGPLEIPKLFAAFERSPEETIGLKLVEALKQSRGGFRADQVKALFSKFPESVREESKELLEKLDADAARQRAHLGELLDAMPEGDVRRGQLVFQKAGCAQCHAMGYVGGHLGPDLTRIGAVRTEVDLLESIIYPSASFVRSYEPMNVVTKSGEQFTGILRKDAPDEVVLAIGPEAEQHIARGDIREMMPGTVSLMPQGFEQALSKQELADLLAFLKNAK